MGKRSDRRAAALPEGATTPLSTLHSHPQESHPIHPTCYTAASYQHYTTSSTHTTQRTHPVTCLTICLTLTVSHTPQLSRFFVACDWRIAALHTLSIASASSGASIVRDSTHCHSGTCIDLSSHPLRLPWATPPTPLQQTAYLNDHVPADSLHATYPPHNGSQRCRTRQPRLPLSLPPPTPHQSSKSPSSPSTDNSTPP